MKALEAYSHFVEQHCTGYSFRNEPSNLYDPLRYFMTLGGKRMRPILTLLGGELFDVPKEESIHAALAIEFFHNFSLIHDDIMDLAPVRRGKTTVHEKWNTNIAILSGDALLVEAYQQLTHYADDRLPYLLKRFNETAIEVCEGQQMDMDFESRYHVTAEEYLEMIRLKTSVLLGCAFEFGAVLGRQTPEQCRRLYDFGVNLGIAFQIQDDILDLYADPDKFGKQVGGDVLNNKKTLLLIEALKRDQNATQELLAMSSGEEKVSHAKKLFEQLGIKTYAVAEQTRFYETAMQHLQELNLSTEKRLPLENLAAFLIHREY